MVNTNVANKLAAETPARSQAGRKCSLERCKACPALRRNPIRKAAEHEVRELNVLD
jgi:hypothetical protein